MLLSERKWFSLSTVVCMFGCMWICQCVPESQRGVKQSMQLSFTAVGQLSHVSADDQCQDREGHRPAMCGLSQFIELKKILQTSRLKSDSVRQISFLSCCHGTILRFGSG